MANDRHSFVSFYPSDWIGGTSLMSRTHRSVYFDICCRIWDKAQPVKIGDVILIVSDLADGMRYVDDLLTAEKLIRLEDGSISNDKAMHEAEKAFGLWTKKSQGGKTRSASRTPKRSADSTSGENDHTPATEPEPEPEPELGDNDKSSSPSVADDDLILREVTQRLATAGAVPFDLTVPRTVARETAMVKSWLDEGISEATVLACIEAKFRISSEQSIGSLKFYDGFVRKAIATEKRAAKPVPIKPIAAQDEEHEAMPAVRAAIKRIPGHANWLSPRDVALSIEGDTLLLRARSPFHADYINANLRIEVERVTHSIGIRHVRTACI